MLVAGFLGGLFATDEDGHQFVDFGEEALEIDALDDLGIDQKFKPIGGEFKIVQSGVESLDVGTELAAAQGSAIVATGAGDGTQHAFSNYQHFIPFRQGAENLDRMKRCRFGTGTEIGLMKAHGPSPTVGRFGTRKHGCAPLCNTFVSVGRYIPEGANREPPIEEFCPICVEFRHFDHTSAS